MRRNYWTEFMKDAFNCSPNSITGNMPCDDGMYCDRCNEDWVDEAFAKFKADAIAEEKRQAAQAGGFTPNEEAVIDVNLQLLKDTIERVKTDIMFAHGYTDMLQFLSNLLNEYRPYEYKTTEEMKQMIEEVLEWTLPVEPAEEIDTRCKDCGGEDCACCEVFIERQADYEYENGGDYY